MSNIAFVDIQKKPFLYHLDSSNNKIRVLFNGKYCYMAYLTETNVNIYIPIPYFELPHQEVVLPQTHILGLLNSSYKPRTTQHTYETGQKRKIGGSSFQLITEMTNQEKIVNDKSIIEIVPPPLPKKNKTNEQSETLSSFARINAYLKQNPDEKINESINKNNNIQNTSISSFSFMKSIVKDAINNQHLQQQPQQQQQTVINNAEKEVVKKSIDEIVVKDVEEEAIAKEINDEAIAKEVEDEVVAEQVEEEAIAEEDEVVINEPNPDDCIIQALLLMNK